jgi:hypothetical protein
MNIKTMCDKGKSEMSEQHVTDSPKASPVVACSDLLAVMGEKPCELTAKKTAWMMKRDKMQVTGFVVTSPTGLIGIVDKSAVRWLTDKEMWWLMHDSPTPIMTANEKGQR